ncbi:Uncharacterised protein [Corynebacterium kutscheri]|uniref:Uncharacterized protein n=1 Tax=Corynebacterium kutscheri TaxID=35755 RepID=A0A0F6R1U5_9CORY|nr:hypothetical protein UL82_09690 [Corynebacterium kutscheri]VEH06037.1 Uncharacterised protein [Corynebacterium kutscheri]VEH10417.1 Uncharacterised protein [Corynebacterium kutscheri]VEH81943.1 Uncharacterised protein [Corynebacterium kutscheri]
MIHYLIEYNRRTGQVSVSDNLTLEEAIHARIEKNRKRSSKDIEVVVITSPSRESLELSHSRYFRRHKENAYTGRSSL